MHILALQPYDAASHRSFLSGWRRHSRHQIKVLSLPGRHFKWRMRQAPVELARQIEVFTKQGASWDALWCTSMLDLATLRGLSPAAAKLPGAVYFHENQFTYPTRYKEQRDVHFGLTNTTSALAAIASQSTSAAGQAPPCVWWNSTYNRDRFLDALGELLQTMPDYPMPGVVDAIHAASAVHYPGIDPIATGPAPGERDGAPVLLWAARWEYDKGPELFFEALDVLNKRGVSHRLIVIGEQFAEAPKCFTRAKDRFADRILRWGYQPTREEYESALREADVVVSTSKHEFFGIAVAEAVSAGCAAVLPNALAYPEVWGDHARYHDQTAESVADAIELALNNTDTESIAHAADRFAWSRLAPQMDDAIEALAFSG
jgi:glycosyltransferase involved in cell wall biosynthesis